MSVVSGVRYVELPVHRCQPTAVPVEVPPPAVWPSHVKLWRCIGSVFALGLLECGVIKEAPFRLNVTISLDKVTFTAGTVPMTNHTACAAQCIVKKKDCNNATHKLYPKSCLCNCRDDNKCPSGKVRGFMNIYLLMLLFYKLTILLEAEAPGAAPVAQTVASLSKRRF